MGAGCAAPARLGLRAGPVRAPVVRSMRGLPPAAGVALVRIIRGDAARDALAAASADLLSAAQHDMQPVRAAVGSSLHVCGAHAERCLAARGLRVVYASREQGNCIGARNFRFFILFLAATATLQALGVLHGASPAMHHAAQ